MRLDYKKISEKKDYLPFYVYDYETIKGQILKLKKHLPPNVKVYYSVKSNPNIAILKIMKNFGLGAEVVSFGEFWAAKKVGFKTSNILFAGATKSDEELLGAVNNGIGLISLESVSEIARLDKIARNLNKKQSVIIRLRLNRSSKRAGKNSFCKRNFHFGISLIEFERLLVDFSSKFSCLDLKGIHVHGLNHIFDPGIFLEEIEYIFSMTLRLESKFKLHFEILNIGGGFGSTPVKKLPITNLTRQLKKLINKYRFNNRLIILELGRYLVNISGSYISEIIEAEERRGVNFISVLGIINHLVRILLPTVSKKNQHRFYEDPSNYKIMILPSRKSKFYPTIIRGQLSSFADTFGRDLVYRYFLQKTKPKDFLLIKGVGAYGLTRAYILFGSRPTAAEFLLINKKLELIRDKSKPEDFLKGQKIPEVLK